MMRFKSTRQCQRFVSTRRLIANLFHLHRKHLTAADHRQLRAHTISTWREIAWPTAASNAAHKSSPRIAIGQGEAISQINCRHHLVAAWAEDDDAVEARVSHVP